MCKSKYLKYLNKLCLLQLITALSLFSVVFSACSDAGTPLYLMCTEVMTHYTDALRGPPFDLQAQFHNQMKV